MSIESHKLLKDLTKITYFTVSSYVFVWVEEGFGQYINEKFGKSQLSLSG
jgi:hypothetical protein